MTFTENDIGNTGKLKREASREAVKIARRENPTLFDYFEQVCDTGGQDPQTVLGDMIVRAIHDDDYADAVFDEVVDLGQLNKDQMRKEDAQMVQELMEALGLNEENKDDPVERLIEQRFEAATNGPMGFMQPQDAQGQPQPQPQRQPGDDPEKEELRQRVRELEQMVQQEQTDAPTGGEVSESTGSEKKDLDELFGEDEGSEESEPVEEEPDEPETPDYNTSVDELFDEDDDDDSEFVEDDDEDEFIEEDDGEVEVVGNDAWSTDDEEPEGPVSSEEATEE